MSRVLVVGDLVDDVGVRPLGEVTAASDTRAEIRMTPGGSAANVAAWLGHLGSPVTYVGRAGPDGVERHVAALAAYGVDARITGDPDLPTATLVLLLDGAGERTMYVDRGANSTLPMPGDEVWDDVGWLHLTGYTFYDPATLPVALDLVATARSRGVGVSVDPSTVAFLREVGASRFRAWVDGVDLLFPNADEAAVLGEDPRSVVTCGPDGALVDGVRA